MTSVLTLQQRDILLKATHAPVSSDANTSLDVKLLVRVGLMTAQDEDRFVLTLAGKRYAETLVQGDVQGNTRG